MEKTILSGISIIFAFIGLYFVLRIWYRWQYIDMDVLKARGFLDKKFLTKNWIYTFLAGASLTAHYVIQFMQSLDYIPIVDWIVLLSSFLELLMLIFLVTLVRMVQNGLPEGRYQVLMSAHGVVIT